MSQQKEVGERGGMDWGQADLESLPGAKYSLKESGGAYV